MISETNWLETTQEDLEEVLDTTAATKTCS